LELFWSKFADIKNTDACLTLCEQQIILTLYLAPFPHSFITSTQTSNYGRDAGNLFFQTTANVFK